MKAFPHRPGFTLPEILLAMALLALIMAAAAAGIHAANTSYTYNSEKTELVAKACGVLDRIARDIRRATDFEILDDEILVDVQSLRIRLPDSTWHTYAGSDMSGTAKGDITFVKTESDNTESDPVLLTGEVTSFTIEQPADSQSCHVQVSLTGDYATVSKHITVTPRKVLF
ncbi:MAG TPA: prepilin-type N-terminal cleavage/methylation domain-containing protein [Phycisphaerae bacterium]|nr:prepilin-type N-terminal cleavage/methylation domain-containing protein [Phycisphaerae bacterium]